MYDYLKWVELGLKTGNDIDLLTIGLNLSKAACVALKLVIISPGKRNIT